MSNLSQLSSLAIAKLYEEEVKLLNSGEWMKLSRFMRDIKLNAQEAYRRELMVRGEYYLLAAANGVSSIEALECAFNMQKKTTTKGTDHA